MGRPPGRCGPPSVGPCGICPLRNPTASYLSGAYGVDAVTAGGCFVAVDQQGAAETTTASAASSLDSLSLSSTADLTTGILTAYAQTGVVVRGNVGFLHF